MISKRPGYFILLGASLLFTACPEEGVDIPDDNKDSIFEQTSVTDAGNNEPEPPASDCLCPEDYDVTPDEDACTKTITIPATNEGTSYEVCDANDHWAYGSFGAMYPDGTKVKSDYWGNSMESSTVNGRLNEVGIWACDPNTNVAGNNPRNEWIGFSHCIELSAKGDYLVGIAGDNRVRLKLNGETIFEQFDSDEEKNFKHWWIQALHVTSGLNIIEMQGLNAHSVASFGAEISGPFPPDSLIDDQAMIDADYANNIVFSTEFMIGQSFDVGEESGWTCPEGYALNRCVPDPECTYIDVIECGSESGSQTPEIDAGI